MLLILLLLLTVSPAHAQFEMEDSHTKASLRGIHALGGGVAWASGTDGTVLRTEDGGYLWQTCTVPPGAEKLDFRGIQGFDANTAIVMSSGKGDLSRLYKTTDGCQSWKLVFTNPEDAGFFDSLRITDAKTAYVLGDPIAGVFAFFFTDDLGEHWYLASDPGRDAAPGAGAFAAGNGALTYVDPYLIFGSGAGDNSAPPQVYSTHAKCVPPPDRPKAPPLLCTIEWVKSPVPMSASGTTSGVFAVSARSNPTPSGVAKVTIVAVGGTYDKPEQSSSTAAFSGDGGRTWLPSVTPPHGYRSSVVYDAPTKAWITVGPNGTDISRDDGKNWQPLHPGPQDAPDADTHWNALSLPFVVGPNGRIGKLRARALQ